MNPLISMPSLDSSKAESFAELLQFDLDIPCGKNAHIVAINVLPWGTIEIGFNPCSLLPPTARRMAGCTCAESIEQLPTEFLRAYELSLCTSLTSQEALSEHPFFRESLALAIEWFREIRVAAAEHVWYRAHHDFDETPLQRVFAGSDAPLLWSALVLLGARHATHHKSFLNQNGLWSWPNRLMALWTLAQWNDPDTQALLLPWLRPEQDRPLVAPLRARLAQTLGQMGNHEAVPVLKRLLEAGEPEVCSASEAALENIIQRLGQLQPPCFSGLIDALSASTPRVVQAARDTLVVLGESAIVPLVQALETEPKSCSAVNRTLIAMPEQLSQQRKTSVPLLLPFTKLEQGDVVNAAMRELIVVDLAVAVPLLYRLLANHASTGVRLMAAMKLGEVGNAEALAPLLIAVKTRGTSHDVSDSAATAVCQVLVRIAKPKDESIFPLLQEALVTPNERVQIAAVHALATIATSAVPPLLLRLCWTAEKSLARPAAVALGKIADETILKTLKDVFPFGDRRATEMAVEAMVSAGGRAVPLLLKAAKDQYPPTRLAAVEALGRIGDSRAGPVLHSAAVGDSDRRVRQAAATAKKKIAIQA